MSESMPMTASWPSMGTLAMIEITDMRTPHRQQAIFLPTKYTGGIIVVDVICYSTEHMPQWPEGA